MTPVDAKKEKRKKSVFVSLKVPRDIWAIKKMQLLSGQHCDMNMHELLAGHLRGTVGVEGFGCDAGRELVVELSVSNKAGTSQWRSVDSGFRIRNMTFWL